MGNTIGQFDFVLTGMPLKDAPAGTLNIPMPTIHIGLKFWTTDDESTRPLISPDLMSVEEIDAHVALLKKELDVVARRAKAELSRAIEISQKSRK